MHLAEKGHEVTLIEMLDKLAPNAPPVHFYNLFKEAWEKQQNLKCIVKASCKSITPDGVTYTDAKGKERTIKAGSIVLAVGMKPKNDLALKFADAADRFFIIGDCNAAGNVQKAMRSAFDTASLL
jgi:2-enoate reductase